MLKKKSSLLPGKHTGTTFHQVSAQETTGPSVAQNYSGWERRRGKLAMWHHMLRPGEHSPGRFLVPANQCRGIIAKSAETNYLDVLGPPPLSSNPDTSVLGRKHKMRWVMSINGQIS